MVIKSRRTPCIWVFLTILFLFFSFDVLGVELLKTDDFSLSLKGYYKNLYFTSKRQATNTRFHADINRIRTEWDAVFWKVFSAKVIWDNELIGGDYVNSEEFAGRQTQRSNPYLDLDYEIARRNNFFYGQSFYRAYTRLDPGPFILTVGRQKIDWGVMRLFSPVDLFTRLPIFEVEKEERIGATAANLMIPVGASLRINPVYAFHPDFDRSRIAGRITKTVGRFDLSLLGGKFLRDEIFGFDFSGDVKDAGVRGEFIYDRADFGNDFVQLAAGVDYGFENTFYFAIEYFFNSQGTNNAATITPFPPTGTQIQSVHEHFIGLQLKYDLTPLWMVALENVVDVNGGSIFIYPETKYSVFEWMDLGAGAQIPVGKEGGEFTAVPNLFYFQTQLFF
jgi:hypothetical protein